MCIPEKFRWLTELFPGKYAYLEPYLVGCAEVTPAAAEVVLRDHNRGNRPANVRQAKSYGDLMERGLFKLNGETIVFDEDGHLRQGQTRFLGCVEAKASFRTFLAAGLPPQVFQTYDQHRKRSLKDVLAAMGEPHARVLASGTASLHHYLRRGTLGGKGAMGVAVSLQDLLETLRQHGGLRRSAAQVTRMGRAAKFLRGEGNVCAAHYLFSGSAGHELATKFFRNIGTMSTPETPEWWGARILLKTLLAEIATKDKTKKLSNVAVMAKAVQAWNALAVNKAARDLPFKEGDDFPLVYGLEYNDGLPVQTEAR